MNNLNSDDVKVIVAELFNCDRLALSDTTGPGDIPQWDSLGHILLLEALAERTGREIPLEDAMEANSIAALTALLTRI